MGSTVLAAGRHTRTPEPPLAAAFGCHFGCLALFWRVPTIHHSPRPAQKLWSDCGGAVRASGEVEQMHAEAVRSAPPTSKLQWHPPPARPPLSSSYTLSPVCTCN